MVVSSRKVGGRHDVYRLWNYSSIRRLGVLTMRRNGAHDEPKMGAHNEPELVLTMGRNTQHRCSPAVQRTCLLPSSSLPHATTHPPTATIPRSHSIEMANLLHHYRLRRIPLYNLSTTR